MSHGPQPQNQLAQQSIAAGALNSYEIVVLALAGAAGAAAVAFLPMPIRVPGHAILKAALPIVVGMAIAPRPFAGTIAGAGAMGTAAVLLLTGMGHLPAAALASLMAFGPALDMARHDARGWQLYARLAVAGVAANLFAFAIRWGTSLFENQVLHTHSFRQFVGVPLLSFVICGIAAGLIGSVIAFRPKNRIEPTP